LSEPRHRPVLLDESLTALDIRPDGCYLDATFGRGGHSRQILSRLDAQGRLLAIDKDPEAVAVGVGLADEDARLQVRQGSFADMQAIAAGLGWRWFDGVLMDLGVSSPQLDVASRGFSFMHEGPLDMRMNPQSGESAADWLKRTRREDLVRVLKEYGEERYAGRIATAIIRARDQAEIVTTARLAEVIKQAHPAWEKGRHPATRCFQAIRIHVNNELGDLHKGLEQALTIIKPGGRLAVISFHSLEDRMVKRFIRDQARGDRMPPGVPVTDDQLHRQLRSLGSAIRPSDAEIEVNQRARSAVLRVAQRL
jgi:16S rRNA (cytosine1402-N4)-methyltransferase